MQRHNHFVDQTFHAIAHKYDFANDLFSLRMHRWWKKQLVQQTLAQIHETRLPERSINHQTKKNQQFACADIKVLDLAGGTGDLTQLFQSYGCQVEIADPNPTMLEVAKKRFSPSLITHQAVAENLPFADNTYDVVAVSFGFRNFDSLPQAFQEIWRVLKPNGLFASLEFCQPSKKSFPASFCAPFIQVYNHQILPNLARWMNLPKTAYQYLARSIDQFAKLEQVLLLMEQQGLRVKTTRPFLLQSVQLIITQK